MQFARPPRPNKVPVDIPALLQDVTAALQELAVHRRIHLTWSSVSSAAYVIADPKHLRTALTCLLRNAVEAAPPDGWVKVRAQSPTSDRLEFVVEDNGDGPAQAQWPHLFDPFYSGRQAGRGRGLGLPTAWRLAREQGGDVRFDALPGGPTRFVLSLPLELTQAAHPESPLPDTLSDVAQLRNGHSTSNEASPHPSLPETSTVGSLQTSPVQSPITGP